jgi:hypothetical protein
MKIIAFFIALLLALALVFAAIGKIFYPDELLLPFWKALDFYVGCFEILFAIALVYFHRKPQMWGLTGLVLASWTGFSLFWYCVKLPCGCMGKLVELPNGITLAFDLIFLGMSLFLMSRLGRFYWWIPITGVICGLASYFLAEWIYQGYILSQVA